jgi:hypothetical protein
MIRMALDADLLPVPGVMSDEAWMPTCVGMTMFGAPAPMTTAVQMFDARASGR